MTVIAKPYKSMFSCKKCIENILYVQTIPARVYFRDPVKIWPPVQLGKKMCCIKM